MAETRIVFYVGFEVERAHHFGWHDYADKMLAGTFGGSTRIESSGSWIGPDGLESEPSLRFELLTDSPNVEIMAEMMAEDLRKLYRQKEVLYSMDAVILRRAQEKPTLTRTPNGYLTLPTV